MTHKRPDPLEPLGRDPDVQRLGRRLRTELRAEAEAYEALVAKDLARSRRLTDVALLLCHRGDLVEATTPTASFVGRVINAADDHACLATPVGDVDLALSSPVALRVVERARRGGARPTLDAASFAARLAEHAAAETILTLGTSLALGDLDGRVEAVALDHVLFAEETGSRFVALSAVTFALMPKAPRSIY